MDDSGHVDLDRNPPEDFLLVAKSIGGPAWVQMDQAHLVIRGEVGGSDQHLMHHGKEQTKDMGNWNRQCQ